MSSLPNKSLLDTMTQKLVESQAWRSLFRHGYPDTPLNQSLVMMGNVFLHLHPVKVSRQAMKITYTWCMGGISFFLFLLLTITGVFLMFYYVPDTNQAYQNINQLSTAISFGHLTRNMHRWAAHLMVVSVTLHMIRVFYHGAYKLIAGGSAVTQITLVRFYVGHVILFPLVVALLMAIHFWRIRKDGGAAGPPPPSRRELEARTERAVAGSAQQ